MSAPGAPPDLSGAWIRASERAGDRLRLELEDLRRGGLVHAGEVVFTGVTDVELASERPMDRPPANPRPSGTIVRVQAAPGATVLDTRVQPGPGEVDRLRFTIRHAAVETRLRPSLARTVRRWVGLYPRPADLRG